MLNSTAHWKPLVNGYSGFLPARYERYADVLVNFPDQWSGNLLRSLRVSHVVVHFDAYDQERRAGLAAACADAPWLTRVVTDGTISIYRVR
jgi:hypothetical protein